MKVDQNDLESLFKLDSFGIKFDLIIDDGLHYQLSNLNTLNYALSSLNKGGYLVIEDIDLDYRHLEGCKFYFI